MVGTAPALGAVTGTLVDDDGALATLWAEHYSRLAGWSMALVGDRDAARDIASEAFVRLIGRWRAVAEPRGFLYATALNLVRDRWRADQRSQRLAVRMGPQTEAIDTSGGWLGDLVQALPERLQAPILLHYYADLTVADVARSLGRPVGTIKRQLSDARALLAEALREELS